MLFLLAASIVTLGLAAVLPDNKVITNIANEHGKIQQDFFNFFESIGENDPKRKETYRSILEGETRREQQAFDSMKDEWRSARFQSGKQRQSHTALKREAEKTSAKMPDAIFFGFTCGKPINEASHREVQENLRDLFDSIQKSDAKNVDNVRNILARETAREKQAFDTAKDELRLARRKSVHKQKDVEHQAAFKREAINDDKKPGDTTSTTSSNSLQRTTDNVEDLREELKADEIPRSHAHNAGLNKAAARLLPVISSLRKDLESFRLGYSFVMLRGRIEVDESRYSKGCTMDTKDLANFLKMNQAKLNDVARKIVQQVENFRNANPQGQEVVPLKIEDFFGILEKSIILQDTVAVRAAKHYFMWKYIFATSTHEDILALKKDKSEEELDNLCSDMSFLYLLSCGPIHVPPVPLVNIGKSDILAGLRLAHVKISGDINTLINFLFK